MLTQAVSNLRTWVYYLVFVGALAAAGFVVVAALQPGDTFPGRLQAVYETLWSNTTGRPYTEMLRENPAILAIASVGILVVAGWMLPRKYWGRSIVLYISLAVGLVAGHVLW